MKVAGMIERPLQQVPVVAPRTPRIRRAVEDSPGATDGWTVQSLSERVFGRQPVLQARIQTGYEGIIDSARARSVQRVHASSPMADVASIHEMARRGTSGSGGPLPHLERIQRSFGKHDVSRVMAHTDAPATASARAMGAAAYTMGQHVAFAGEPVLHTAAHEAAHVIQQRAGVQLASGVGRVGDRYEQHADAVAREVVQGRSAEALLDQHVRESSGTVAVQHECSACAAQGGTCSACSAEPVVADVAPPDSVVQRQDAASTAGGCMTQAPTFVAGTRVRFDQNMDQPLPGQDGLLAKMVKQANSASTVELHGNASLEGPGAYNRDLSCRRAVNVRAILAAKGMTATPVLIAHGATGRYGDKEIDNRNVVLVARSPQKREEPKGDEPGKQEQPDKDKPKPDEGEAGPESPKFNYSGLNRELAKRFNKMVLALDAKHITYKDITGLRSASRAHLLSTAYHIRERRAVSVADLKALNSGKDLDGNVWYKSEWEQKSTWFGLGKPRSATDDEILAQARDNAFSLVSSVPKATSKGGEINCAYEGYAADDEHRKPNVAAVPISNHVSGNAIDLTDVEWEKLGGRWSEQADQFVASFGLDRPYRLGGSTYCIAEHWHFELGAAPAPTKPPAKEPAQPPQTPK